MPQFARYVRRHERVSGRVLLVLARVIVGSRPTLLTLALGRAHRPRCSKVTDERLRRTHAPSVGDALFQTVEVHLLQPEHDQRHPVIG
jgi:hypothetical protein